MKPNSLFSYVLIASVVFVVFLGVGYAMGYRIGPGISLVKTRDLHITGLPSGATIFADDSPRGTASASSTTIALVPGSHAILISANSYWPWTKIVTVPTGENVTVHALLVPKSPNGALLSGTQAKSAKALIKNTLLPSRTHPLTLENGCALISVSSSNQIIATPTTTPSCATPPSFMCVSGTCAPTVVFSPVSKPTDVTAYPGRQDALLVGVGNTVYALSLDPRNPRTFAPILHGVAPRFAAEPDGSIVVTDQAATYKLHL